MQRLANFFSARCIFCAMRIIFWPRVAIYVQVVQKVQHVAVYTVHPQRPSVAHRRVTCRRIVAAVLPIAQPINPSAHRGRGHVLLDGYSWHLAVGSHCGVLCSGFVCNCGKFLMLVG